MSLEKMFSGEGMLKDGSLFIYLFIDTKWRCSFTKGRKEP
jgi:hypothetical protein